MSGSYRFWCSCPPGLLLRLPAGAVGHSVPARRCEIVKRMRAVFGRGDWVANGVLFTLYHLHVPWVMPAALVEGIFLEAYPTRRFQSAWMGIIVHAVQSVFVIAIVVTPRPQIVRYCHSRPGGASPWTRQGSDAACTPRAAPPHRTCRQSW
jgi:hypothetical protein